MWGAEDDQIVVLTSMTALQKTTKMTVEEFFRWAAEQPGEGKYELHNGVIVEKNAADRASPTTMAPERFAHTEAKFAITAQLKKTIRELGKSCEAVIDGLCVMVVETTSYIPDVLVNCGRKLAADDLYAPSPVIVIEVLSASTRRRDAEDKLFGYFRLSSVEHYVMVDIDARRALHYQRAGAGRFTVQFYEAGRMDFYPPGLSIDLDEAFAALPANSGEA